MAEQDDLRQSFSLVKGEDPDAYAKALGLAGKTGIPTDVVQRNQAKVEQEHFVNGLDFDGMSKAMPRVTGWLKTPENAAVAKDDLPTLQGHERLVADYSVWQKINSGLSQGIPQASKAISQIPGLAYDVLTAANPLNWAMDTPAPKAPEFLYKNALTQTLDRTAEAYKLPDFEPSLLANIKAGNLSRAGSDLAYHLALNSPSIAQSLMTGFSTGAVQMAGLGLMGAQTAAPAAERARDAGRGTMEAVNYGLAYGAAEVIPEKISFGLFKPWETAIANAVGKDTARRVLTDAFKTILANATVEGSEEVVTSVAQGMTDYYTGMDKDALKNLPQNVIESFLVGAAMGGGMQGPAIIGVGASRGVDMRKAAVQVKQTQDFYTALGKDAEASKLRERLPEKYQDALHQIIKGGPVENIFMPVQDFEEYAKAKGLDPAGAMLQLGLGQQYDQAKVAGTDISIPLAQFVSTLVPTEHYQGLKDAVKFDPNGLTGREYKAMLKEAAGKAKKMDTQAETEAAQAAQEYTDGLVKAGLTPDQASTQATMLEGALKRIAASESQRTGAYVSPAQVWAENRIQIQRGGEVAITGMEATRRRGVGEPAAVLLERQFAGMDQTARENAFLMDPKTGLLGSNAHAYERDNVAQGHELAHLQFEGTKYFNDAISHSAGDDIYRVMAKALESMEADGLIRAAAKVGGDFEFQVPVGQGPAVEAALRNSLPAKARAGSELFDLSKLGVIVATGTEARDAGNARKEAEVAAGTYGKRGEAPVGALALGKATEADALAPMAQGRITPEMRADAAKKATDWKAVYLDSTGMLNATGWDALEKANSKAYKVHADLDHLGKTNADLALFGDKEAARSAGDAILTGAAKIIQAVLLNPRYAGIDAAHISGDEYYFQADDLGILKEALAEVENALLKNTLQAKDASGNVVVKAGITSSFGIGVDHDTAEQAAGANKKLREQERADHGWRPQGAGGSVVAPALGRQSGLQFHDSATAQGAIDSRGADQSVGEVPQAYRQGSPPQPQQATFSYNSSIPDYPGREMSDKISKVQEIPARLIEPTEKVDEAQVQALMKAMQEGRDFPAIVVEFSSENDAGEDIVSVVDGHTRLEAAKRLGYETIPVRVKVDSEDYQTVKQNGGMKVRVLNQAVYHGTPHKFDKFTLDHIGSGEGAQAYGWGLYFAGEKKVAEFYRDTLAPKADDKENYSIGGKVASDFVSNPTAANRLRRALRDWRTGQGVIKQMDGFIGEARHIGKMEGVDVEPFIQAAVDAQGKVEKIGNRGSLYTADIPEDSELLDYDKPLSEQAAGVREKLKKALPEYFKEGWLDRNSPVEGENIAQADADPERAKAIGFTRGVAADKITGNQLKILLQDRAQQKLLPGVEGFAPPEAASRYLLSLGIPGLRYLDANSRAFTVTLANGKTDNYSSSKFQTKEQAENYAKEKRAEGFKTTIAQDGSRNYVIWDEASIQMLQEMEQANQAGAARGSLTLPTANAPQFVMSLFKDWNLSTPPHEFGHWYLETLSKYASLPGATPELAADYQAVRDYLGMTEAKPTREQHELFANSLLKYLQEGKAPARQLEGFFAKMKVWLLALYREAGDWANINLTPEIRGVFDRMLASEEGVAQTRQEQGLEPLFPVGTTGNLDYDRIIAEDAEQASAEVLQRQLGLYNKQREAWASQEREQVEADQTARIMAQPIYKAGEAMLAEGGPRIDPNSLPTELRKGFPRKFLSKDAGLPVQVVAEMMGFADGMAFAQQLKSSPTAKQAIKAAVQAEMEARYPAPIQPSEIPQEVQDAIHNEKRTQRLAMEMQLIQEQNPAAFKGLMKSVASRPRAGVELKARAEEMVGQMTVAELKPYKFLRAESKAANEAARLLAKNDAVGALEAKQRELLNHEIYRAMTDATQRIEKSLDKWKGFSKPDEKLAKSRDMALVNAGRAILAQVGLGGDTERTATSYLEPLKEYDPNAAVSAYAIVNGLAPQPKNYLTMGTQEFLALADGIDALWRLSRTSNQVKTREGVVEREEARGELEAQFLSFRTPPSVTQAGTSDADKAAHAVSNVRALLTRVESWIDLMDNGDINGPFRKYLWTPVKDATIEYKARLEAQMTGLKALLEPLRGNIGMEPITAPELNGFTFQNKGQLLGALLHSGNDSNLGKLLRGYGWGQVDEAGNLDRSKWDEFTTRAMSDGTITKQDMDFVQGVWDLLEGTKPEAQKAHLALYGYTFSEVTAAQVSTPFGDYRGGYFPAVTDKYKVPSQVANEEKEILDGSQNTFMFPSTGKGFTKARTDYAAPLSLDLGLIGNHVDKVMRFAYLQPTVSSVYRLVKDRGLDRLMGPDIRDLLTPWLQRVATQRVATPGMSATMDRFYSTLRSRAGLAQMVLNVPNTLQQFTGLAISAVRIKPSYLVHTAKHYLGNSKAMAEFMNEKSTFMRGRVSASVMDIQSDIKEILLNPSALDTVKDFAQRNGYILQTTTQGVVDVITWRAAYDQAIAEKQSEQAAVDAADAAVTLTQGSFGTESVARFETGSPAVRLFTMFAGYFNMQANLLGTEFAKVHQDLGWRKGAGRVLYVGTMGLVIPAIVSKLIMSAFYDKDEDQDYGLASLLQDMGMGLVDNVLGFVPVAGNVGRMAVGKYLTDQPWDDKMSLTPAVKLIEATVSAPDSVYKAIVDKTPPSKAVKDVLGAFSFLTGIPAAPLGKPLGYAADVAGGDQRPAGPVDVTRGLVTGRQ